MDVAPHWIQGKVIEIQEKKVLPNDNFWTSPCVVEKIPIGTTYYEIVVKGEEYIPNYEKREKINKNQIEKKLIFFEFPRKNNFQKNKKRKNLWILLCWNFSQII